MLMLALLLFPILEKSRHDFEHAEEIHCSVKDKHFCRAEHNCKICDYLFASSSTPPTGQEEFKLFGRPLKGFQPAELSHIIIGAGTGRFLRGPPAMG